MGVMTGANTAGYDRDVAVQELNSVADRDGRSGSSWLRFYTNLDLGDHLGMDFHRSGVNTCVLDVVVYRDLAAICFDTVFGQAFCHMNRRYGTENPILFANLGENNDFDTGHFLGQRFGIFLGFRQFA